MTAAPETKNAVHEFLAYQTRMAEGVLGDVTRLAKQIARDAEDLTLVASRYSVAENRRPDLHHTKTAAHLAHALAEYSAKLTELAAMQTAISDLREAMETYPA